MCQPLANHADVDAAFLGFFVDVIRERHVAPAEIENFIFIDCDGAEFMHGAGNIIFEVTIFR